MASVPKGMKLCPKCHGGALKGPIVCDVCKGKKFVPEDKK